MHQSDHHMFINNCCHMDASYVGSMAAMMFITLDEYHLGLTHGTLHMYTE